MITSMAFTVYPVSNMEWPRAFYEHVLGLHVSHNYRDVWVECDLGNQPSRSRRRRRAIRRERRVRWWRSKCLTLRPLLIR